MAKFAKIKLNAHIGDKSPGDVVDALVSELNGNAVIFAFSDSGSYFASSYQFQIINEGIQSSNNSQSFRDLIGQDMSSLQIQFKGGQ